jgi:hypothetical protein
MPELALGVISFRKSSEKISSSFRQSGRGHRSRNARRSGSLFSLTIRYCFSQFLRVPPGGLVFGIALFFDVGLNQRLLVVASPVWLGNTAGGGGGGTRQGFLLLA